MSREAELIYYHDDFETALRKIYNYEKQQKHKQGGDTMLKREDFENIITVIEGTVDYDWILMLIFSFYFDRAMDMKRQEWDGSYERYLKKAEDLKNFYYSMKKVYQEV